VVAWRVTGDVCPGALVGDRQNLTQKAHKLRQARLTTIPPSCPIDERTLRATTRVGSGLVFIATSPWPNVPNVNGPEKGKSECSCKCSQSSHLQPPGSRQRTGRAGTWSRLKWRTLCELGVSIASQKEGQLTDCPNACMEDHKWTPDVHTHRNIWGYDLHNRPEKVPISNANESAPINAYLLTHGGTDSSCFWIAVFSGNSVATIVGRNTAALATI
jgi:hypothetical protein